MYGSLRKFFSDFMSHGLGVFPSSLPADMARGALPHSVSSGARVFVPRNTLSRKRFRLIPSGHIVMLGIVWFEEDLWSEVVFWCCCSRSPHLYPLSSQILNDIACSHYIFVGLKRTWDQKLSSGWMLSGQLIHVAVHSESAFPGRRFLKNAFDSAQ